MEDTETKLIVEEVFDQLQVEDRLCNELIGLDLE